MATAQDWIDQCRGFLEDWGNSVSTTFTLTANDASGTIYQLPNTPIKTSPLPTMTDNGGAKTYGTDFTINFNNAQLTVLYTQTNTNVLVLKYDTVLYRDERILNALGNGVRRLYPRVYKQGECYIAGTVQQFNYNLTSTTDVPDASSFPAGTCPPTYVASVARTDLVKAQTRIHSAEYLPVGWTNVTSWRPFNNFSRTTNYNWETDTPFNTGDVIKLVYSAPCTVPTAATDTVDVPDEYTDMPVWYAAGTILGRKESVRDRSDSYQTQNAVSANPVGTQRITSNYYMQLFQQALADVPMRPMSTTMHVRTPAWARRWPW